MIFLILSSAIMIFVVDGLVLIKKKQWKEFTIFTLLLAIAIFLQIVNGLGLSSPISIMNKLISPLGKAVLRH